MKKDNKGFTLVEMLVVVSVIAVLSIAIGFSVHTFTNNAQKNSFESTMLDVFNAASSYAELSTSGCNGNCNVTIQTLIEKGLLDKNILNKNNPMYEEEKFNSTDVLSVSKVNGVKDVTFACPSNSTYSLRMSELDEYSDDNKWGQC